MSFLWLEFFLFPFKIFTMFTMLECLNVPSHVNECVETFVTYCGVIYNLLICVYIWMKKIYMFLGKNRKWVWSFHSNTFKSFLNLLSISFRCTLEEILRENFNIVSLSTSRQVNRHLKWMLIERFSSMFKYCLLARYTMPSRSSFFSVFFCIVIDVYVEKVSSNK